MAIITVNVGDDIPTKISGASSGDTLQFAAGTHTLAADTFSYFKNLNFEGPAVGGGAPTATINITSASYYGISTIGGEFKFKDLAIDGSPVYEAFTILFSQMHMDNVRFASSFTGFGMWGYSSSLPAARGAITNCHWNGQGPYGGGFGGFVANFGGGNLDITNNTWTPGSNDHYFAGFCFLEDFTYTGTVMKDVVIDNNSLVNTSGTGNVRSAMALFGAGGNFGNMKVSNNTFQDLVSNSGASRIVELRSLGSGFIDDTEITDNTFQGVPGGILMQGFGGSTLESVTVADNTFDSCLPSANGAPADFPLIGLNGPAVMLNAIVGNDYTQSGYGSLGTSTNFRDATIWLESQTTRNVVKESGNFPAGQGGPENHILDQGPNNRVVGLPASRAEKPAGVGALMSSESSVVPVNRANVLARLKKLIAEKG